MPPTTITSGPPISASTTSSPPRTIPLLFNPYDPESTLSSFYFAEPESDRNSDSHIPSKVMETTHEPASGQGENRVRRALLSLLLLMAVFIALLRDIKRVGLQILGFLAVCAGFVGVGYLAGASARENEDKERAGAEVERGK